MIANELVYGMAEARKVGLRYGERPVVKIRLNKLWTHHKCNKIFRPQELALNNVKIRFW